LALVKELARSDERPIAVSARGVETLEGLVAEHPGRVWAVPLDVTDRAATGQAIDKIECEIGAIEMAVLNAGTYVETPASAFDAGVARTLIETNVLSAVWGIEALVPRMLARGSGHIAVTASVAGYRGLPRAAAYCASKGAVIALCESLRADLASRGILIQVCSPGFVRTPLTDRNTFKMPFLMKVEDAARLYAQGLRSRRFEIAFPLPFVLIMKLLRMIPAALYFPVIRRITRQP
jgi:NAD(P)-dependent dehydrogenase (short-subunit alcohol dehydrogenase family)